MSTLVVREMEVDDFLTPYKRPPRTYVAKPVREKRRPCCCLSFLTILLLAVIAVFSIAVVYLYDRVQYLESRLEIVATAHNSPEYLDFRSKHVECFVTVPTNRMFMTKSHVLTPNITSPDFTLSGYRGQLQLDVVQASTASEYLSIKYRPISGLVFPMHKMISILLLNPQDDDLGIQKQFSTREEIGKGATMFVEPNGSSWGTNFCTLDIINRFVNNNYICVEVKITDPNS